MAQRVGRWMQDECEGQTVRRGGQRMVGSTTATRRVEGGRVRGWACQAMGCMDGWVSGLKMDSWHAVGL